MGLITEVMCYIGNVLGDIANSNPEIHGCDYKNLLLVLQKVKLCFRRKGFFLYYFRKEEHKLISIPD